MHYVTFGKKKKQCVIFLHGWGGNKNSWGNIPKIIAGFGFYSVVVDFPGFGESDPPRTPYYVSDYANEIKELSVSLGVTTPIIIGHSFGGRVGIKLAGNSLVDVKKLVLVDSAGIRLKKKLSQKLKESKYKKLKKKVSAGKLDKKVLELFGSSDYKALKGVMRETFLRVINEDLSADARNIAVETLLVWGKKDQDTPLKIAKKLKRLIKNSELVVYENAGHFSYLEQSNHFIDLIYEFMLN